MLVKNVTNLFNILSMIVHSFEINKKSLTHVITNSQSYKRDQESSENYSWVNETKKISRFKNTIY